MKKVFAALWRAVKAVGRFLDHYIVLPIMGVLGRWMMGRVNAAKAKDQVVMKPWKSEAVEDFRIWVGELPDEKPRFDDGPFEGNEIMMVLKEFATLRQEIAMQNQEQHKTTAYIKDLLQSFQDASRIYEQNTQGLDQLAENIRLTVEKDVVLQFVSLRDILVRGQVAAQAAAEEKSFLRRPPAVLDEAVAGYDAAILRLDRALDRMSIYKVPTVGHMFDPKTMVVAGRRLEPGRARNIVLEEQRSGYERQGEAIRTAEVVVNG
ncbi:Molecular chaperone GrpE (heat shock protein) [Desulfonatronum thiosulfatophilum]|uniref:Molecular chaperone GrpE (Heat shock protein) n=1 Tax=Desulfonatronum thiosulfatophilum TaxID=617002 RepID=A0A1G6C8P3_9BACT|nr:nucleotide exchange factor GrpE [Desulfonatronum thiosulfatophilum]SDB29250.1 Molecular chaperone GrpE (heat shock protein) [Desulfonatronum thiosulfatophilum]